MNTTTYAKRTQYKPIDFFFRGVVDSKSKNKKVVFVDAFQVLNDRYLGRMNASNYFAIAESSVRINELNIIALEELRNYDLVMRENFLIPDNVIYSLPISTRFFENEKDFGVLIDAIKDVKYKKSNLILCFYASTVVKMTAEQISRYNYLRKFGYKTCIIEFGDSYNSLDIFSVVNFDYLRCESSYFDASPQKKKVLQMIVNYCKVNKVGLIMDGVDQPSQYQRYKREGITLITGRSCSKLSRWVTNEFLGLKDPVGEKLEEYKKKLEKELNIKKKEEDEELEALRQEAIQRAEEQSGGRIMPSAPRPELAKSPYQIRLEQQKQGQKKETEEIVRLQARLIEQEVPEEKRNDKENKLIQEMSKIGYEGDVKSALALTFAKDNKFDTNGISGKPFIPKTNSPVEEKEEKPTKTKKVVTQEESGIIIPERPELPKAQFIVGDPDEKPKKKKAKKPIVADTAKEEKLFGEFKKGNLFDSLGPNMGLGGIGVMLKVKNVEEDEPDLVGTYNDKGQWVDTEGNVFNGYFNVDGEWIEYEDFDDTIEGHYNDKAQWVDKEGNVYDGYFDEEGRWIDYTFQDTRGEVVDNGYFDEKINKWVPFGYFDNEGTYHKF